MTTFYTIEQYQYYIYFSNDGKKNSNETSNSDVLHIKAINHVSLSDYRCDITKDRIKDYGLIPSLDILYDILSDGFLKKKTDIVQLGTTYDIKKNEIYITLILTFPYKKEIFHLKLESVKDLANQDILNNKMNYFNKRLTDLEGERKEIQLLTDRVDQLTDQLYQHQLQINIAKDHVIFTANYATNYCVCILSTGSLNVDESTIKFTSNSNLGTISINYANCETYGILPPYYFTRFNYFTELDTISIKNVNWPDLTYIRKCTKITNLTIEGLDNLIDISAVLNFIKLKTLSIRDCRKIKNLKILEECKSLQLLKIHSSINTGVFSEALSFPIEIIQ